MFDPASTSTAAQPGTRPTLTFHERRVLGVLIEKAKTTADAYPMSINGLTTGCNQKSNRDPILNLSENEVEETLRNLQGKGLVLKITGTGRVDKYRHNLYNAWEVDKVELAVLAELLLRGAQTEGELRTRASRMEEIENLDKLRSILRSLAERKLVVYLTPEGKRGKVLIHGFCFPRELEDLRRQHSDSDNAPRRWEAASGTGPAEEARITALETALTQTRQELTAVQTQAHQEVALLRTQLAELQANLAGLRRELHELRSALGG